MKIRFWKMHGAGNDFVLADDRDLSFPDDARLRARLCRRPDGVGAEGLLLLQPSRQAAFRMRFFNPDGCEADLCGNGARCAARLARDLGAGGERMVIETGAGLLHAEVSGRSVSIGMPDPRDWRMDLSLDTPLGLVPCDFVNTGVPHAVVDLDRCPPSAADPVARLGPVVRSHPAFGAAGANADFYRPQGPRLALRTFERGVEAETGACGTGAVATALVAARRGRVAPPVAVRVANGNVLTVGFQLTADGAAEVTLQGPAEYVFTGEIEP